MISQSDGIAVIQKIVRETMNIIYRKKMDDESQCSDMPFRLIVLGLSVYRYGCKMYFEINTIVINSEHINSLQPAAVLNLFNYVHMPCILIIYLHAFRTDRNTEEYINISCMTIKVMSCIFRSCQKLSVLLSHCV